MSERFRFTDEEWADINRNMMDHSINHVLHLHRLGTPVDEIVTRVNDGRGAPVTSEIVKRIISSLPTCI